jgi:transposase
MGGKVQSLPTVFCVATVEDRVPRVRRLRTIKKLADKCLKVMHAQFEAIYAPSGRPSVPPERLLKGQLLIALFSIRCERQLCEQLEYNLSYRSFPDTDLVEPVCYPTSFTQNRDWILSTDAAPELLKQVMVLARGKRLMRQDHFPVDGSFINACASHKSFRPNDVDDDADNNRWSSFKRQNRSAVIPHVALSESAIRHSAVADEVSSSPEYRASLFVWRRIEQIFGWIREVSGFRPTRYRGEFKVRSHGHLVATAYNLLRIAMFLPA